MKKKLRSVIWSVIIVSLGYGLVAGYLIYSYFKETVVETIKLNSDCTFNKAFEISNYLNSYMSVAGTIEGMMSSAQNQYGYKMLPYVNTALAELAVDNEDVSSITLSWDYSVVDPSWMRPYGRYRMRTYMKDGLPKIKCDTLDLQDETLNDSYYQLKNAMVKTIFTSPYINNVDYSGKYAGKYCVMLTRCMTQQTRFLGTIGVEIPVSNLSAKLQNMPIDFIGKCYLVASSGKIAYHDNEDLINTVFSDAYTGIDPEGTLLKELTSSRIVEREYVNADYNSHFVFTSIKVENNNQPWVLVAELPYTDIYAVAWTSVKRFIILALLGFLLTIVLVVFTMARSTRVLKKIAKVFKNIENGTIDKVGDLISTDEETNAIYKPINDMAQRMKRTTEFARQIGQGNLDIKYETDESDQMGMALLEMQKNLLHARVEEKKRIEENEKLSWSQNGLAQLGEYLRMSNTDIGEFSFNIISFLVKYVDAMQGGMFVTTEKEGKLFLELKAAYAFDRKKQLEGCVEFGESLVGRCAVEKKTIYLTDVPDGYLYITSGLGENKPKCLLLVPLQFEDEILGVIEIASLREIKDYQITFFNNVAERIGSTISNIKKNVNTAELLNKFRTQSNELARREKEISANIENVRRAQDEVRLSEIETIAILDILSQTSIITRYELDAKVIDLRDLTLNVTGLRETDIVGHNFKEIYNMSKNDVPFDDFWKNVLEGNESVRFFNRGKVKFREVFSVIKDNFDKPFKIISVAVPLGDVALEEISKK